MKLSFDTIFTNVVYVAMFCSQASPSVLKGRHLHMKTIAVFGGTGKTGREVVYQALKEGLNVVVLARDPSRMLVPKGSGGDNADRPLLDSKLKVLKGSVTDPMDVRKVFEVVTNIVNFL
jgi:NAD(P)-dependent dehydrogenase (short-subunit alcohol dehydrogenase family)